MKQYKSILLVLFLILGCQREIEHNDNTKKNAIPMSFYAGIEMPTDSSLTKTVLDGYPTDAFRNVLWEYQDKVYVTNGLQSSKFINTSQGTSEVALLEGELEEGTYYFAAYPYKMVTSSSTSSITVNLPSEQTYCKDGIESETFPMVAQCENGIFNFKNLCGIFVLQLVGDKTISSITFSGKDSDENDMIVAGKGIIAMDYSDVPVLNLDDSATTSVTLICPEGVALNRTTPTMFHIVLPEGNYNSFEIRISATDGSTMEISSDKPLTIKRSMRTTAAELTYSGVVDASDLNLSGETANCYIVSEAGSYKFKTVKGNSSESVGDVAEVEVLWESFGTEVRPNVGDLIDDVSYSNGRVYFSTPDSFREGNAVIAAKDEDGVILWSWHIWLVEDDIIEHTYLGDNIYIDRFLGATSSTIGDPKSLGLLYQWGRKDPFVGTVSSNSTERVVTTKEWPPYTEDVTEETHNLTYAIANPMTFITGEEYDGYIDWCYHYDSSQGEYPSFGGTKKTIYDPCPPGWRVPHHDSFFYFNKGISLSNYEDVNNGSVFPSIICGKDDVWYPMSSIILNDGQLTTSRVMWTTNSTQRYGIGNWAGAAGDDSSLALPVRCQKEVSKNRVETSSDLSKNGTANCYIINKPSAWGYRFKATKGNSNETISDIASVEVLWENNHGKYTTSNIIKEVWYKDLYVYFTAYCDEYGEEVQYGNAIVAAKNSVGNILWSWHIWSIPDTIIEQEYANGAGVMMDRNLGATSIIPGTVESMGLLYQWGRKDPFVGAPKVFDNDSWYTTPLTQRAHCTIDWPLKVESTSITGTIEYSVLNPTTFIEDTRGYSPDDPTFDNFDWVYCGVPDRWMSEKTIYDPCPPGWRIPDSGESGIWNTSALSSNANYNKDYYGLISFNAANNTSYVWYPATGHMDGEGFWSVGAYSYYWATYPNMLYGFTRYDDIVLYDRSAVLFTGRPVRCQKE